VVSFKAASSAARAAICSSINVSPVAAAAPMRAGRLAGKVNHAPHAEPSSAATLFPQISHAARENAAAGRSSGAFAGNPGTVESRRQNAEGPGRRRGLRETAEKPDQFFR
jgi:hypothetical protein